jgi:hypothetical protein
MVGSSVGLYCFKPAELINHEEVCGILHRSQPPLMLPDVMVLIFGRICTDGYTKLKPGLMADLLCRNDNQPSCMNIT